MGFSQKNSNRFQLFKKILRQIFSAETYIFASDLYYFKFSPSYKGELTGMLYLLYNTVVPQFVLHISTAFWIASSSFLIVMSNNKKTATKTFSLTHLDFLIFE